MEHSGAQFKRTWPIGPNTEVLKWRWRAFLRCPDRSAAFKQTRDRKITSKCLPLPGSGKGSKPLDQLPQDAPTPSITRYAYHSFDRQWVLADSRLGDFLRPELWRAHGEGQVYITTLLNHPLGQGPALTCCALIPDLHHFRGSYGAKEVFPLYRTADAAQANILPGLLDLLSKTYGRQVSVLDFLAYVYGVLTHSAFTSLYSKELETRELRVPITKDATLFESARKLGAHLLWLHTYGERFVPKGKQSGDVPHGAARCTKEVPGAPDQYPELFEYYEETKTLRVGTGEFAPVLPEVFEFQVSGLKVVQSWLKYRMKKGAGKKSSLLDDIRPERWTSQFTTELLELLWVLELTIASYPEQEKLLQAIVTGKYFQSGELPEVPESMRKPPKAETQEQLFGRGNSN